MCPSNVGRVKHAMGLGVALECVDGTVVGVRAVFFDGVNVSFALFQWWLVIVVA